MQVSPQPQQNRLLAALPKDSQARIFPELELTAMPQDFLIHEPQGKLRYAYFPTTCIISKISSLENGSSAEIGVIGNEGMVSVCLFLGGDSMPHDTVVCNAGFAYRIRSELINDEFARCAQTQQVFLRYTQALITQMAQIAVCNQHHSIEQRLCHFLLLSLDRSPSIELAITQERIANMLGVRREGITEEARKLQDYGYIRYRRGHIEIIDRYGLEDTVCECYDVVKSEFDRLMPPAKAATAWRA